MDNVHQFFRRPGAGIILRQVAVDEMLADMVLDHFGDEAIERTPARGGLLQDLSAFPFLAYCPFDCLDLAPDPFEAVQQLGLLSLHMSHL
jgi:hypothetical protein